MAYCMWASSHYDNVVSMIAEYVYIAAVSHHCSPYVVVVS